MRHFPDAFGPLNTNIAATTRARAHRTRSTVKTASEPVGPAENNSETSRILHYSPPHPVDAATNQNEHNNAHFAVLVDYASI